MDNNIKKITIFLFVVVISLFNILPQVKINAFAESIIRDPEKLCFEIIKKKQADPNSTEFIASRLENVPIAPKYRDVYIKFRTKTLLVHMYC